VLRAEAAKPYFASLQRFVAAERAARAEVYPAAGDVFRALELTPLSAVRVVVLGQDPYHDAGQAHGLAFSVPRGVRAPPSLQNILTEVRSDVACAPAAHGCLEAWARQGVLLLNTLLTVVAHTPLSHKGKGWETFTDALIRAVAARRGVVFLLWGKPAQAKEALLDKSRHCVLTAPHPSPLSGACARRAAVD
jgi:uracil-DNA glycosylase